MYIYVGIYIYMKHILFLENMGNIRVSVFPLSKYKLIQL